MEIVNKPVERLIPYENNPRDNSKSIDEVAKSIKEFGFHQPIVVDKDNIIIVGHTRLLAAKKLGYKEVPVEVAENLTDEQVLAYRLADNKTSEGSLWDNKKLLEELDKIDSEIYTGFVESEIFDDVLDESDKEPIEENKSGVVYTLKFQTQDEVLFEQIEEFIRTRSDV